MCIAGQPAARYGTALLALLLISVPAPAGAQGRQGNAPPINLSAPPAPPAAAAPAPPPRSATGRVLLAGSSGARGIWMPIFPFGGHLTPLDQVPFQPWARAIYDDRLAHQLEPHARCKASGGVRQIQTPYGIEIVELPEQQVLYIFDIGGPHSYRTVYMDGRTHPPDVTPIGAGCRGRIAYGRWSASRAPFTTRSCTRSRSTTRAPTRGRSPDASSCGSTRPSRSTNTCVRKPTMPAVS